MLGADRERGRHGDVRQTEVRERAAHEVAAGRGRADGFVHVEVKHRPARVLALQIVLHFERFEGVVREVHGELRRVRVVGVRRGPGLQDVGEALAVLAGEAVGRAFRGRRLEVVHVVRLLLEGNETRAHMIEEFEREGVPPGRRDVVLVVREVADHLVEAVDADRREVIAQRSEIALGVGEEPLVDVALNDLALDFETRLGELKEVVKALVERFLVALV